MKLESFYCARTPAGFYGTAKVYVHDLIVEVQLTRMEAQSLFISAETNLTEVHERAKALVRNAREAA